MIPHSGCVRAKVAFRKIFLGRTISNFLSKLNQLLESSTLPWLGFSCTAVYHAWSMLHSAVFTPRLTAGFSCLTCEWVVNPLDNKHKHIFLLLLNLFPFICHKFWLVEYMKSNCIVDCGSTAHSFLWFSIFQYLNSSELQDCIFLQLSSVWLTGRRWAH